MEADPQPRNPQRQPISFTKRVPQNQQNLYPNDQPVEDARTSLDNGNYGNPNSGGNTPNIPHLRINTESANASGYPNNIQRAGSAVRGTKPLNHQGLHRILILTILLTARHLNASDTPFTPRPELAELQSA